MSDYFIILNNIRLFYFIITNKTSIWSSGCTVTFLNLWSIGQWFKLPHCDICDFLA